MKTLEAKSFFQCLFDMSFSSFVTIKIIKLIFILSIVGSVLIGLSVMLGGFTSGTFAGILGGIIGGPIVAIMLSIFARVNCELILVAFRIADNTGKLVELQKATAAIPPADLAGK